VLDLPVNAETERGLLGMALHPQFATNQLVYLFYTAAATQDATAIANRVSRFTWNGTTLTNEQIIIDLPVTLGPNHDGGIITFGPPNVATEDQKLFIIIGDLNRNNQTENYANGAAPDNTGVVVRLNDDGTIPTGTDAGPFYSVAGGNLFLQMMYAYGIRNSYGMDFDPVSGALWDTENGPSTNDEINRIDPGFNSGWERAMGYQATTPANLVQFSGVGTYSNPEFTWFEIVAPTAIHFYRGNVLGAQYPYDAFAGATNGKLYRFDLNQARTAFVLTGNLADTVLNVGESDAPIVFGQGFGVVTDIRTGPDGNLYVVSLTHGTIYRIRSTATAVSEWNMYE
jgi:glucose/arabinose dehydrogenase